MARKIGVLGGGQLGLMMGQSEAGSSSDLSFLDPSKYSPAAQVGPILEGSFRNGDDVLAFGKQMDLITIEIEDVSTSALYTLQEVGKLVHPLPSTIDTIKDKGTQKEFYQSIGIPTSGFFLVDGKKNLEESLNSGKITYPFVAKLRTGGYDGKGVFMIDDASEWDKIPDEPLLIEEVINVDKELSLIIARNQSGETSVFPPVEMVFDSVINLIDYQFAPADISGDVVAEMTSIANTISEEINLIGLMAIEFFLDKDGKIWINESAPRPHNSGHHTIEACNFSQFDLHLMAIQNQNLPLIDQTSLAGMVNLVGTGEVGEAEYMGLEEVAEEESIFVHIYGKSLSKPGRKMGHVTILADDPETLRTKIEWIKKTIFVRGKTTEHEQ